MKNLSKSAVYGISAIGYFDIVINPNKHLVFLKLDLNILACLSFLAFICLITLIVLNSLGTSTSFRRIAAAGFFLTASIIINEVLFSYSFHQPLHFIVAFLLAIPFPIIISNWSKPWNRKLIVAIVLGSFIALFSTLIYFTEIYIPYEDYIFGFPNMFVHYWIRNWIIFISIILLITALLKKNNRQHAL